jgi:hypothetical protein
LLKNRLEVRGTFLLEYRGTPAVIVLLGLLVRVCYLLLIAQQGFVSDAASYVTMASDIAQGKHFIPFWPPGVPLYLAMVQCVAGGSVVTLRLAMLLFYFGLSAALWHFTLLLTRSRSAGSLALLVLAFAPEMVCASVEPVTEIPTALFLTLVAVYLLRSRLLSIGGATALGLSLGGLALMRPASLPLLVAVPLYLLWQSRRVVQGLIPFAWGTVLVLAWILTVYQQTGRFVLINTANAKNIYLGNNPNTPLYRTWWLGSHHELEDAALPVPPTANSDPIALDAEYSAVATHYIQQRPDLFLLRTVNRVCVFFAFNTFTGAYLTQNYGFPNRIGLLVIAVDAILYIALGLGAILFAATLFGRDESTIDLKAILALCVAYALPYFFAFSHPRYHVPIEPLLMGLFAAFCFPHVSEAGVVPRPRSPRQKLGVAMAIALFLAIQIEFFLIAGRAHG